MPTSWENPDKVAVEVNDPTIEIRESRIREFRNPIRVTASQTYAVVEVYDGEGEKRVKRLHVFPYTSVMSFTVISKEPE